MPDFEIELLNLALHILAIASQTAALLLSGPLMSMVTFERGSRIQKYMAFGREFNRKGTGPLARGPVPKEK